MAIFSDLANELITGIWSFVTDPDDIESFALVSKRVYSLSAPFLEEDKNLKRQYSTICFNILDEASSRPAQLLESMLQNPRIAVYIRKLEISSERWGFNTYDSPLESPRGYSDDTMLAFKSAIQASPFITCSEADGWITSVRNGDEEPIIALILTQLTKMRKFRLDQRSLTPARYLLRILDPITQPSDGFDQQDVWTKTAGKNAIQSTSASLFSTVNELSMRDVNIELDVLVRLLRSIRELKSFNYSRGHPFIVDGFDLCNEVLQCSQHSLKYLSITGVLYSENPLKEISKFSKLEYLWIDLSTLLGTREKTYGSLADVLPISIERVTLYSEGIANEALKRLILETIKSKMERLPKFQTLSFCFDFDEDWDTSPHRKLIKELQEVSGEVGICLRAT